jgi:SAM-dependent methyltransferase
MPVGGRTLRRVARGAERVALDSERDLAVHPSGPAGLAARTPSTFRLDPPPAPIRGPFEDPPDIPDPGGFVRSVGRSVASLPPMDIELFEALNAEYASHPLVPDPTHRDSSSRAERARRRLETVHDSIGLAGQHVLEFGCGAGFEIWYLDHWFGADAVGVDVVERKAWASLAGPKTRFIAADLAVDRPFEADSFDRIISFSVFEHVEHPHAALAELYRIMRPGGLAWISANLHRGPRASHQYRHVTFPYPHLLFGDDVFREFFRRRGLPEHGASWVNRLTWTEYEQHFLRLGFRVRALRFTETDIDETFYRRFEDILGRYPRWDLTKDFFQVVLEKPATDQPRSR